MSTFTVDLNCDVGEGMGNEAGLFPLISSCNIACGGHAGDPKLMRELIRLAMDHGLKIGAHLSYPDREHFGRRSMELSEARLRESLSLQMDAMHSALDACGARLHHIKAHGALYNDLAKKPVLAERYLDFLDPYRGQAILFSLCGSLFGKTARARGFEVWEEGFADRAYRCDGNLMPRSEKGAVLHGPEQVLEQVIGMVRDGSVGCDGKRSIPMKVDTICVHGDTPQALEILTYLSRKLANASIRIAR